MRYKKGRKKEEKIKTTINYYDQEGEEDKETVTAEPKMISLVLWSVRTCLARPSKRPPATATDNASLNDLATLGR
ncbi:hypothetical protein E2C01_079202 [Portunus trituberculatus]|uniref:Uncharacterized protein n=1 Tax=Portunus trituberculatus TaxID=210409 RepID=A0A5B7IW92_PORTR|nr:hypothetical protein [Portunus trituberculatus]